MRTEFRPRLNLNPALAPQRYTRVIVMISQARVVVVAGGMVGDEPLFAAVDTEFEVAVLEGRRRAIVSEREPAYDPTNERLRA